MSDSSSIEDQSRFQLWILLVVGAVFAVSLALYFSKFHGSLSDEQGRWGEFGDFMGGVVNPIVGFCTVWLLTVSLRQNQISLRQAKEELALTRRALEDVKLTQERTEAALTKQIEIADQTRDISNAVAIWTSLDNQSSTIKETIREITHGHMVNTYESQLLKNQLTETQGTATEMGRIMKLEIKRLIGKYPKPK